MSKKKKENSIQQEQQTFSSDEKRAAKKAAVLGEKKKSSHASLAAAIICIGIIVTGGIVYYASTLKNNSAVLAETPVVTQSSVATLGESGEMVIYPTALFASGVAQHFDYQAGDLTIKYFILKSSDGIIRAAFDACDVCWPAGKGYYQESDHMVCRNCGRRFPSNKINEVKGGCNPAPLNRTVKDGQLSIQVKDILEGTQYFDFSQHT